MLRTLPWLVVLGVGCGAAEEMPSPLPDPCTRIDAHALVSGLPNTGGKAINFKLDQVIGLFYDAEARGWLSGTATFDSPASFSFDFTARPDASTPPATEWLRLRFIEVRSEGNSPTWSIRDPASADYVLRVDSVCPGTDDGQTQAFVIHGKVTATLQPEDASAKGNLDAVVTF